MANQSDYTVDQRGGIKVRDYTRANGNIRKELGMSRGFKINFDTIAHSLVWVSLGLGVMEVLMPKRVQKMVGIRRGEYSGLIRLLGLREISSAFLILMQSRPNSGVWSRIIGDAMDLGLLGAAFTAPRVKRNNLTAATASIVGITALDALTAAQLRRQRQDAKAVSDLTQTELDGRTEQGFHLIRSITINADPARIYQFWRNFENLPQFMYHLQSVRVIDDTHSHWVAKAPAGTQVEWDAEITADQPNQMIAWQSVGDALVPNMGVVHFKPGPGGKGTVVLVEMDYRPPTSRLPVIGSLSRQIARIFGEEPTQQVMGDLARLKQVIETGEVIRSDSTPQGIGGKGLRPAQPLPDGSDQLADTEMGQPLQSQMYE